MTINLATAARVVPLTALILGRGMRHSREKRESRAARAPRFALDPRVRGGDGELDITGVMQ